MICMSDMIGKGLRLLLTESDLAKLGTSDFIESLDFIDRVLLVFGPSDAFPRVANRQLVNVGVHKCVDRRDGANLHWDVFPWRTRRCEQGKDR